MLHGFLHFVFKVVEVIIAGVNALVKFVTDPVEFNAAKNIERKIMMIRVLGLTKTPIFLQIIWQRPRQKVVEILLYNQRHQRMSNRSCEELVVPPIDGQKV